MTSSHRKVPRFSAQNVAFAKMFRNVLLPVPSCEGKTNEPRSEGLSINYGANIDRQNVHQNTIFADTYREIIFFKGRD